MLLDRVLRTGYAYGKTLAISVPTVLDAALGRLTRARCDARLADWSAGILAQAGVTVTTEGLENVPSHPVVFMSNHASHLDVPVLYAACPGSLRMVAKAELFKVPVWGQAMRDAGFVAVERSGDRARAKRAMDEAGEIIRSGTSVWIAPEGTRSRDGRLGKLKRGGFRLAGETSTPIVPMVLLGTGEILPPGSRLFGDGGHVTVRFGELIPVLGKSEEQLMAEVRTYFERELA